jgi:hydrogenase nickel incorporation protein HypB
MCATCGCSDGAHQTITDPRSGEVTTVGGHEHGHDHAAGHGGHDHAHGDDHAHGHDHDHAEKRIVLLEQDILAKNDRLAASNRDWFTSHGILALNLMSSPGAGKTTLLVRTITDTAADLSVNVIEGDQETALDAERIAATSAGVVQVNTGSGCHLEAAMLADAIAALEPAAGSVLMIENVGNLVCPAMFDLGEAARVVIMSTTEGNDKPLKYPQMFRSADLVLINKIDLAPHVDFNLADSEQAIRTVNPRAEILAVSARTGEGLGEWYAWLRGRTSLPAS